MDVHNKRRTSANALTVMGHVANDAAGGTDMFFGQDINESCFNAQDQGWMWSFNAWM